jgi:hypothetical protein
MPRQASTVIDNNFSKGLITEFTGLNFPDNACTETENCIFERTGRVTRRLGFDLEVGFVGTNIIPKDLQAINYFLWKNVAGDGTVNVFVLQVGGTLYFFNASTPATCFPLSASKYASTVDIGAFIPAGSILPYNQVECQFATGHGFLFVTNPYLDPFYVTYNAGVFTASKITIQIRDFKGVNDGLADNDRPLPALSDTHRYNLGNQGWSSATILTSLDSVPVGTGLRTFNVDKAFGTNPITIGQTVTAFTPSGPTMSGTVTSYAANVITINVNSAVGGPGTFTTWFIGFFNHFIDLTWFNAFGNYPSNSDVWWVYKNASDVFDPANTFSHVVASSTPAPKGHYILNAFIENRAVASGIPSIATVTSGNVRPSTVAFFAGRVFYAGVHFTGYNNKIYFSQTIENDDPTRFGRCYQNNDPTDENLFDLLPTDGGVITVQGASTIHKLVALNDGLLVFASNGIYMIVGSSGAGFFANDYAVVTLEAIPSISASNFVDVKGMPMWWNNDGIYMMTRSQEFQGTRGGLIAQPLTTTTIDTFYGNIPAKERKYAKGWYNKSDYIVQWVFRSTPSINTTQQYEYDSVLNFNTITGAFYPWTIGNPTTGDLKVNGVFTVEGEGAPTGSQPMSSTFKYITSNHSAALGGQSIFHFSEQRGTFLSDWFTFDNIGIDYESFFISGYKVHGDGIKRFQVPYINIYNETPDTPTTEVGYKFQGIWDYAKSGNSGRFTVPDVANIAGVSTPPSLTNYGFQTRRHKVRGRGYSLQYKIFSIPNVNFYIIGWSALENKNVSA